MGESRPTSLCLGRRSEAMTESHTIVETIEVLVVVLGSPAQNRIPAKVVPHHEGGEASSVVLCLVEAPW